MKSRSKVFTYGVVLAAAFLNAIIVFVVIPGMSSHLDGLYNGNQYADGYDEIASNLVAGNGYRFRPDTARTIMREPGYPILLAGIFWVFGGKFALVKAANVFFTLVSACLITRISARFFNSRVLILGPPLLFLFHPGTLIAESRGGTEILFACLLILFILTVYRAFQEDKWLNYAVSGGILGLTVLVRSTPILFPVALLGYLLVFDSRANLRAAIRNIAIMCLTMFAVLSPWIARNYGLTGKFVPTATVLGVSAQTGLFLSTHHPIGNQGVDREAAKERNKLAYALGYDFKEGYYQYFYNSIDEIRFSQVLLDRVVNEYKKSPLLFAKVVGFNLFNFWFGGRTSKSVALNAIVQLPLLVAAGIGLIFAVKTRQMRSIAPFSLLIVYIVAISVPILALARYSVPLIPFVSILACVGAVATRNWIGKFLRVKAYRRTRPFLGTA